MTAGRSRLEISMAAEPGSVRLVRTEIMRWFHELRHADDGLAASIAVAVSEAVGNVVRHAYPGEGTGRVEVEAQLEETTHRRQRERRRHGHDRARRARPHNGMGLPVIGRLADGVTVVSDDGGTRLSMRFELGQRGSPPDGSSRRFTSARWPPYRTRTGVQTGARAIGAVGSCSGCQDDARCFQAWLSWRCLAATATVSYLAYESERDDAHGGRPGARRSGLPRKRAARRRERRVGASAAHRESSTRTEASIRSGSGPSRAR